MVRGVAYRGKERPQRMFSSGAGVKMHAASAYIEEGRRASDIIRLTKFLFSHILALISNILYGGTFVCIAVNAEHK